LLGEVPAQFGILVLGEEFVMIDIRDGGLGRGDLSLLCKEAGLRSGIDSSSCSSDRAASAAGRGRGGECEVDGIGKKAM